MVALMEVEKEEEEVAEGVVTPHEFFGEGAPWEHFFRCTWQCRFSDDDVFQGAEDLEVLPDIVYTSTNLVRRRAEMGGEAEEEWLGHFRLTIRGS